MPVNLMMRGNDSRWEAQTLQFHQIHSLDIRPDQIIKYLVITGKRSQYAPAVHPAGAHLIIIIFRSATITAELLVCPAITDPVPAFKAHRSLSWWDLVFHRTLNICANIHQERRKSKMPIADFSFSYQDFSFSYRRRENKKNICMIKKATNR